MQIPPLSLAVLLTTAVASAQVATSAQLVSGIVVAGSNSSAALQPGADIWPGLVRSVESLANGATLLLDHHQDAVEVALHWQLTCQAINNGNSVARVEACYELVSPVVQGGELIVEWLPSATGTGQTSVAIDVYDDGYIDNQSSVTSVLLAQQPVAFQQYPLRLRVIAEVSAQAGSVQGPWGSSWSWNGSAAAELRIRFVPTHAMATTVATQACATTTSLSARPNLSQGVELAGVCSSSDTFAVFALGFQAVHLPLPLAPFCDLLVDPVITLLHPVPANATIQQPLAIPLAVRPTQFLSQFLALDTSALTLVASDLVQVSIQ